MRYDEYQQLWQAVLIRALQDVRSLRRHEEKHKTQIRNKKWWQNEVVKHGLEALHFFNRLPDLEFACYAADCCPRQVRETASKIYAGDPDMKKRFTTKGAIKKSTLRQLRNRQS
jgi:hypothetical protein